MYMKHDLMMIKSSKKLQKWVWQMRCCCILSDQIMKTGQLQSEQGHISSAVQPFKQEVLRYIAKLHCVFASTVATNDSAVKWLRAKPGVWIRLHWLVLWQERKQKLCSSSTLIKAENKAQVVFLWLLNCFWTLFSPDPNLSYWLFYAQPGQHRQSSPESKTLKLDNDFSDSCN